MNATNTIYVILHRYRRYIHFSQIGQENDATLATKAAKKLNHSRDTAAKFYDYSANSQNAREVAFHMSKKIGAETVPRPPPGIVLFWRKTSTNAVAIYFYVMILNMSS